GRRGQTALMWAAAEGHVETVEALITAGADFRTPLDSGFTPLLFAVREGKIAVVRTLLKAGANVNETVKRPPSRTLPLPGGRAVDPGSSALLVAVWNGHFELAAELLKAGADPNADGPGYTALHALARVRKSGVGDNDPSPEGSGSMTSLELVKEFASHGADLNKAMTRRRNLNNTNFNEVGATPFLLAALTADAPFMKTLAELGADPLLTNRDEDTALMAAAGLGTRSPGEDAGTEAEVLEALQVALDLGVGINTVSRTGETAMHGAAYKNLPKAVDFLAAKGASPVVWNRQNEYGWTPLTIARGYRIGNFKPSPETVSAVEGLLRSAGITPPTEKEENAKGYDIYAPKPPAAPAR
ncbi:MAG: ankyrin repeat domain-containing protein, partial [Vicinamibacterales bacterium]